MWYNIDMRIGNTILLYQIPIQSHNISSGHTGQTHKQAGPGVVVDISREGWAAYARDKAQPSGKRNQTAVTALADQECKTCGGRKYKDFSDDPSVSFQTPTHISPGQAAASVASHESEHVSNERVRAQREGRKIVSQTVTLKTSICPECKRVYISGGTAYTVSMESSGNT